MAKVAVESASEVCFDLCGEKVIRVLHVDDDVGFLAVAKQCLEDQSRLQVDTALSAEDALEKLRGSKYDVVVSDYQMVGKNGLELLKELRQEGNDVPFILFTCKGKEEIVIEAAGPEDSIEYWRDAKGIHHVPKRNLTDIITAIYDSKP